MKVYITWPAWSWKSTVAKKLGDRFGVGVVHLDELLWLDDWTENPKYGERQKTEVSKEDWIIEWPSCSIVRSMADVDAIVVLDFHPLGNVWRMIFRRLKSFFWQARVGSVLPDRITADFILRTWNWRTRQYPRLYENIESSWHLGKTLFLHHPSSVEDEIVRFLTKKKCAQ